MKRLEIILLILIPACTRPSDTSVTKPDTSARDTPTIQQRAQVDGQEDFPEFVKQLRLPDSLLIDVDHVIYGDFNADASEDFASVVTNLENGFQGVLIIHNTEPPDFLVFGAGNEINGMTNLRWIDTFQTIQKGEVIAPTLVDEQTGDIIGEDETKQFRLLGEGIFMHVDEAGGGGILFWNGTQYEWYHIE